MNITLNPRSIFDEIFALSALLALNEPQVERPALLSRDQIPGLKHLMRMAFANLVMQFAETIKGCRFADTTPADEADYDPTYPIRMQIDLLTGFETEDENSGKVLVIKSTMEHIVALNTLSFVFDRINPELSRNYRRQAAESAELLGEEINPTLPAGRIASWYY